ncbi:thiamine pyrophosphate-binding protein [Rhizohabitans arisaemae]|uniref:thiamine pyrophosphate-binding protein n=1 Tax=Rhizohabitans arisaemae TaxID=2720610 RepID=UPI0024B0F09D|nr:thiamine pyrophosphate-binding protein [Rhizohabitans arisaemae]
MTQLDTATTTGGALVVRLLKAMGARVVFGVPGGQTLAITDAILGDDRIRFVTARHEGAAACMADAYGRLTGEPGVCLATTGPGATNMLTGVGGAFRDSSPVIAITCNNRLPDLDRDDAQGADHVSIFRPLVKWSKLVSTAGSIRQAVEEAYLRARTGSPGPVLLDFARDVIEGPVPQEVLDRIPERYGPAPAAPSAAAEGVADLAARLLTARRPTLWIGNGVKVGRAGEAALALAETLDMPVVTTFNGIGAVPTGHELVFGSLNRMGTGLSTRVLADTDLLLVAGNSLNAVSTGRWSLPLPDRIVQIDVDPTMIGRYYAERTTGLLGDAGATLTALARAVAAGEPDAAAARDRAARLRDLSAARAAWWETIDRHDAEARDSVSPATLMRVVRGIAPDDTVAIVDAGNPGVWSYLWEVRSPGAYIKPVGFGNMGFAVPAAIGAQFAAPGAPIIVFVGDGSLGMSLGELETLAREDTPAVVVVLNDSGYGNIRQEQIVHYGADRTIGVDFGDVDFATVARGCGVDGERVRDVEGLAAAVRKGLATGGPYLVDVVIDPAVNAWTFPAFRPYTPEN